MTVLVELRDARVTDAIPRAISDVAVAGAIPRDAGRACEAVARDSGSGRPGRTATTSWLTASSGFGSAAACTFSRRTAAGAIGWAAPSTAAVTVQAAAARTERQ
jgi:hypothetical protein